MNQLDQSTGDLDFGHDSLTHRHRGDWPGCCGGGQPRCDGDAQAVGPGDGRARKSDISKLYFLGLGGFHTLLFWISFFLGSLNFSFLELSC